MDERNKFDRSSPPVERGAASPRRLLKVLGLGELYMLFLVLVVGLILTMVLVLRFPNGGAVRDVPVTPTPVASLPEKIYLAGIR
jgi:hypothetical protein